MSRLHAALTIWLASPPLVAIKAGAYLDGWTLALQQAKCPKWA
jgi:hypothetical protein